MASEVMGTIAEMESLSFEKLPDIVPMADILSGKAKDGSEILLETTIASSNSPTRTGSTTSSF